MPSRRITASAGTVAALVLTAGGLTLLPGAAPTASAQGLVPYASCSDLLAQYRAQLEESATPHGFGFGWGGIALMESADSAVAAPAPAAAAGASRLSTGGAVGSGPTGTNVQERGVDEPDIAKTSGDLLFALSETRLEIVRTGEDPEVIGSARIGDDAWAAELLVDADRVLVLVPHGRGVHHSPDSGAMSPAGGSAGTTTAKLFDVSSPTAPRLLEELQVDGRYLSARLADGAVRLVTMSAASPQAAFPQAPHGQAQIDAALEENRRRARNASLSDVLPQLERRAPDGGVLSRGPAVACEDVRHAPNPQGSSTLVVTTLDLDRGLDPRHTTGVTTDGDVVYATAGRLYVATSRWGTTAPPPDDRPSGTPTATVEQEVSTELHAFDTSAPERTTYVGSGSVPGYILGRWALSSYDGHLRVATTSAAPWNGGSTATSSSVVVLEERENGLAQTGRVDGLGVGERIYAVRYFGDLATVVTFRQTDPLYVLDLADPQSPRLLGELKVPGFSTYLHPVGDDRLLGVGHDADAQGRVTGMQVSLFDLSDRSRPMQLDRLSLGQGWSAATDDSRAFGYDPKRRTALMAFSAHAPCTTGPSGVHGCAAPTSMALGIRVDGDRLVEAGRIEVSAHSPAERVLHDDERLYAVSRRAVVVGDLDSFTRTGAVDFTR